MIVYYYGPGGRVDGVDAIQRGGRVDGVLRDARSFRRADDGTQMYTLNAIKAGSRTHNWLT